MARTIRMWVVVAAATASGVAWAAKPSKLEVCQNLRNFEATVVRARNIGPQTTVGEAKAIGNNLRDSYKNFVKSAEPYAKPQTQNVKNMIDELRRTSQNIPKSATLQQVQTRLRSDLQQVRMANEQLLAKLNCPSAGGMQPMQGEQPNP